MNPTNEKYITATDQLLVEWSLQGERAAFDALTMRYHDAIKALLKSRLSNNYNSQIVDDLLQDSLMKAFIHLASYNPKYAFGQWIFTITKNTFVDFYRKQHDDISLDERFAISPEESSPNPEQSIINSQTRAQIDSCIAKLPPQMQSVFTMRFIDELSYDEIAQKTKLPIGSVKTNIHRARTKMTQLLTE